MICYLFEEPSFLFFTTEAPELLYYSHIPATVLALLIGFFVYFSNRKHLLNKLLLLIALCFSTWTTASLLAWTNTHADFLAAIWSIFAISVTFLPILSVYFIYVFLEKRDVGFKTKIVFLVLTLPVLLFSHTDLNISGFNLANCDAFDHEGLYFKAYYTALGFISIAWILAILIRGYKKAGSSMKKQILLIGSGMEFFLISFITTTFIVTYLVNNGLLPDSRLEMYSLFGMVIFMTMVSILIVKFNTFRVGMVASQALVVALIILVASQYTYTSTKTTVGLTTISLLLTSVIGFMLIRSVKKEIKQREKIESLAGTLEKANARLQQMDKLKSEFVSIASHQLRSPITAISGYASLLIEGSYGEVPSKMKEPIERIVQSARMMAVSIEDYLNVSRIEAGNMKYNLADFNLNAEVEHISDDLRSEALKRGLVLLFRKRVDGQGIVNADIGKVQQIIHNLINNAIKYTEKGAITVYVHDDSQKKKIYVDFLDTGIGMKEETLAGIFQKFERGDKANTVNVTGTGLGLYVAQKMAEAMHGTITAHSEGEGQGSRFTLELPLVM
jgi:signal transduction histidine kinase